MVILCLFMEGHRKLKFTNENTEKIAEETEETDRQQAKLTQFRVTWRLKLEKILFCFSHFWNGAEKHLSCLTSGQFLFLSFPFTHPIDPQQTFHSRKLLDELKLEANGFRYAHFVQSIKENLSIKKLVGETSSEAEQLLCTFHALQQLCCGRNNAQLLQLQVNFNYE